MEAAEEASEREPAVTVERDGTVSVVVVSGDLDRARAEALRERLASLLAMGERWVVVDMGRVGLVDGTGLGVLVDHFVRLRIGPGDLRLCCLQPWVAEVLRTTRLDLVFEVFGDRASAVASYRP